MVVGGATAMAQCYVYILCCADGRYDVGSTTDVAQRVVTHNAGSGPRFTACRRPVILVYTEAFDSMDQARQREIQVKKWSRAKKEALIRGDTELLHTLSRRRQM
jgi:predicted GIY-YIG superfamily endonuclease